MSTVTFYIGPKQRVFIVHKAVLCRRCVLFERLETMSWNQQASILESLGADIERHADGSIYLPSTDPEAFQRLNDFLYSGRLRRITRSWALERNLYLLADILGAHELMNRVMDKLQLDQLQTNSHFTIEDIRWILDKLEGSPLSWYAVSSIACRLAWGNFNGLELSMLQNTYQTFPRVPGEIQQVMSDHGHNIQSRSADYRRADHRTQRKSVGFGPCQFHCHPAGSVCHLEPGRRAVRARSTTLGAYKVEKVEVKLEEVDEPGYGRVMGAITGNRRRKRHGGKRRTVPLEERITRPKAHIIDEPDFDLSGCQQQ